MTIEEMCIIIIVEVIILHIIWWYSFGKKELKEK